MAVYGAVGFGILEGVDLLAAALGLPASLVTIVALAVIAGFPLALVLSWSYRLSPDGVARTAEAEPGEIEEIVAAPRSRRWPSGVAALLGITLFGFGSWFTLVRGAVPSDASVAVLPFADMSEAGDQEYFADGIAEEILNALVRVPGLRVTSRTSAFAYKNRAMDLRQIGQQLGVAAVLEGSVRQDSGAVRVTAQLIDVRTGYHLWSESFTRDQRGIFEIQDEIARAIANALRVSLLPARADAAIVEPATGNPDAYDDYLRGRFELHRRTPESLLAAVDHFDRAVQRDPEFAPAWAGLGLTYGLLPFYSESVPFEVALAKAREAADRAVAIDPDLPEAYSAVGQSLPFGSERAAAFRRAIELNPASAEAHQWLGETLSQMGRHEEAVEHGRIAVELDSMSRAANLDYGRDLWRARRFDEAAAQFRKMIARDPTWSSAWGNLASMYVDAGAFDSARAALARSARLRAPWQGLELRAERRMRALERREREGVPFELPAEWAAECATDRPFGYLQGVTECLELLAAAGQVDALAGRLERFPVGSNLGFPFDLIWDHVLDDPRIRARKEAELAVLQGTAGP
jgi:TolB-like protein/thioredoxin-like negative regulator of GroEL